MCGEYFRLCKLLMLDADPVERGLHDHHRKEMEKFFRNDEMYEARWGRYSPVGQCRIAIQCGLFLMILHMRCERRSCIVASIAYGALKRFLIIMCLHVNLQVIAGYRSISNETIQKRDKLIFHEIARTLYIGRQWALARN